MVQKCYCFGMLQLGDYAAQVCCGLEMLLLGDAVAWGCPAQRHCGSQLLLQGAAAALGCCSSGMLRFGDACGCCGLWIVQLSDAAATVWE